MSNSSSASSSCQRTFVAHFKHSMKDPWSSVRIWVPGLMKSRNAAQHRRASGTLNHVDPPRGDATARRSSSEPATRSRVLRKTRLSSVRAACVPRNKALLSSTLKRAAVICSSMVKGKRDRMGNSVRGQRPDTRITRLRSWKQRESPSYGVGRLPISVFRARCDMRVLIGSHR
jgi:hypothetical protein